MVEQNIGTRLDDILDTFKLTQEQRSAVVDRGRDVVVTAGAGSGKTLTLVARYISLLAERVKPRRIAAITFTKKAAREMRSRARKQIFQLSESAPTEEERQKWFNLSSQMDAARIGTIHSLCTEILRAHPAEAGLDPRFEVLDEGVSAALRVRAIDDSIKKLVEDAAFSPLLIHISTRNLSELFLQILKNRFEADDIFKRVIDHQALLSSELSERLAHPALDAIIADLMSMTPGNLVTDAGEKLAGMVSELLGLWADARSAIQKGDPVGCANFLHQARRTKMDLRAGKRDSTVKGAVGSLREHFDTLLNPLTGGKDSGDIPPSQLSEDLYVSLQPLLKDAFGLVHQTYKSLLDRRQGLDFDDLEYYAQKLLAVETIRTQWQGELDAVLVDEFQDTNQRQRDIVEALAGNPGRLFVVGDRRQSIYRFRRADVTVFSDIQERIAAEGGLLVDLQKTYRTHEPLLEAFGDILSSVIGTAPDPTRKYYVPFSSLTANNPKPPANIASPYIEFVIGSEEESESAKTSAAHILAQRLLQLKEDGQIQSWDEVALLFRATSGYADYEEALEDFGIPFVTIAGKGFYDRPEIRDMINIIRTLADPFDDVAFAGLLRSPAFGLSDAGLFLLREKGQSFWDALQGNLITLNSVDRQSAERARLIISGLLPLVDRIPVSDLLKRAIDVLDYRAILATADNKNTLDDSSSAGGRLWRNLDKLLEDAIISGQVSVRNFLEYLKTLNDSGAREGEAPAEAEGAVRLMTIHKAKGLEFNVVVLAHASRDVRSGNDQIFLSRDLGAAIKLDPPSMLFKLAKFMDADQSEMENLRLLYVALTRVKHKLIISGHARKNEKGGFVAAGWTKKILEAVELSDGEILEAAGEPFEIMTTSNHPIRVWWPLEPPQNTNVNNALVDLKIVPVNGLMPLYRRIKVEKTAGEIETLVEPYQHVSRQTDVIPGKVLGRMVHKAIQRWIFPGDSTLEALLEAEALNSGLATTSQRKRAMDRAVELLGRFRRHPISAEIESAAERYQELPYVAQGKFGPESRYIDLLFLGRRGWQVVDFKTDPIYSEQQKEELISKYKFQVIQYRSAANAMLDISAKASLCFLDFQNRVEVVDVIRG